MKRVDGSHLRAQDDKKALAKTFVECTQVDMTVLNLISRARPGVLGC